MYNVAIYIIMCSISKQPSELCGKRVVLFSYGSGLASSLYSLRFSTDCSSFSTISNVLSDIPTRLKSRKTIAPSDFEKIMKLREETHHKCSYVPVSDVNMLFPGTYYLKSVDDKYRRSYERVPPISLAKSSSPLRSPLRLTNGTI